MTQGAGITAGIGAGVRMGVPASAAAATSTSTGTPGADATQREQLAKAAKAFEAIFVRQLVGSMRGASQGESLNGSSAVDQFQELSDAKMADGLAESGGLGIASMLLRQLGNR